MTERLTERLYTQAELFEMIEKANDDGLQAGAQVSVDAYHEGFDAGLKAGRLAGRSQLKHASYGVGFHDGYAAAVSDHEAGELHDPEFHLRALP